MRKICLIPVFFCVLFGPFLKAGSADAAELRAEEQRNGHIRAGYRKISAEDALRLMRKAVGVILLDVRTEAEYRETKIPGAKLLPVHEIAARAESELPDKNVPILVYCRSGRRSEAAAGELAALGYTRVYDMGGILNWPYEKE